MSEGALGRWLLIGAGLVVLATITAGVFVTGLPSAQRDEQLDQRRVRDLERIVDVVDSYVKGHEVLPSDLDTLARQPGRRLAIVDPVDGSRYAYEVTGDRAFRLCAVFATDTAAVGGDHDVLTADQWLHGAGRQCFDRKVDDKSSR